MVLEDPVLKEKGQRLLDAAYDYWKEAGVKLGRDAVRWLQDDQGRVVIFTRGEYRETLMRNVDLVPAQREVHYFKRDEEAA